MNTSTGTTRNQRRRRRRRVRTRRPQARPVVVALPAPRPRQRRRRNQRRPVRTGPSYPYDLFGLKCNDKGYLTFGPSSDAPSLGGGILKAFGEYRVLWLEVHWKAQASSTAAGSMAIQISLGANQTTLDNRAISFKLTNSGSRRFTAKDLGGDGRMLSTTSTSKTGEDQFRLLYAGNGDGSIGGDLLCKFALDTRFPR